MNVILRKMYHFTAGRNRLRSIHTKTRDCSKFRFLEHSREQKHEVYAVTTRKRIPCWDHFGCNKLCSHFYPFTGSSIPVTFHALRVS